MKKVTGLLCFLALSLFYTEAWASSNSDRIKALTVEAERGDASAQTELGILYTEGDDKARDYQKARAWFELAGKQNYADAEYNLGVMYGNGDGVKRDNEKARNWFEKAAAHGHTGSRYNLGVIYGQGIGVPADLVRAEFWFTLAAQEGSPEDKYTLGVMYSKGESLPKNDVKAREWFEKAANEGHVLAEYNLAVMYSEGLGGDRDLEKAQEWANKAASQGDPEAARLLTLLSESDGKQTKSPIEMLLLSEEPGVAAVVPPARLPSSFTVQQPDAPAETATDVTAADDAAEAVKEESVTERVQMTDCAHKDEEPAASQTIEEVSSTPDNVDVDTQVNMPTETNPPSPTSAEQEPLANGTDEARNEGALESPEPQSSESIVEPSENTVEPVTPDGQSSEVVNGDSVAESGEKPDSTNELNELSLSNLSH